MTDPRHSPIGVFDSGLGGLTVLRALKQALPFENYLYLGDVARLPYGSKSQNVVQEYAQQCVDFLVPQPVKAVVIACNTASAMALGGLEVPRDLPVFGVVSPGALAGVAVRPRRVLVMATHSTVKSEAYLKSFAALDPALEVEQLACPLLVPLAEEGWFDHPVTEQVISHYFSGVDLSRFDAIVLGCTHFPLLEPSLRKVIPPQIAIVHGGGVLAEQVRGVLQSKNLLNPSTEAGRVRLWTTDRVSPSLPLFTDWVGQIDETRVVHLR